MEPLSGRRLLTASMLTGVVERSEATPVNM
jgi:hypothetical protein